MIDHCSVSWAIDEGVSTWYDGVRDITFSNNIVAEILSESLHPENEHSKGLLIGDHSRRVAVIGNLFAHNMRRNPMFKGDTSTIIAGNLIYNPGTAAIDFSDREFSGPSRSSIRRNVLIRGTDTEDWMPMISLASRIYDETRIGSSMPRTTSSSRRSPFRLADALTTAGADGAGCPHCRIRPPTERQHH